MNNSADYLLMCGCVGDFPPFLLLRGRFRERQIPFVAKRVTQTRLRKNCVERFRHADAASRWRLELPNPRTSFMTYDAKFPLEILRRENLGNSRSPRAFSTPRGGVTVN